MKRPVRTIAETELGYRRGIVLGLTMAETMLLLLFCLMLASAAILVRKDAVIDQLTTAVASAGWRLDPKLPSELAERLALLEIDAAEVQPLQEILDEHQQQKSAGQPSEFWRELRQAAQIVREMNLRQLSEDDVEEAFSLLEKSRSARSGTGKGHEWPPIIRLSEADGYSFDVGSAQLSPKFENVLETRIVDRLAEMMQQYDVDVIEVIGHTDEQRVRLPMPNFDDEALPVTRGEAPITGLVPADNASLGLARAIAVTNVLRSKDRLANVTILPLSGGQLIMPGDRISDGSESGDVAERRRIEIRLRRRVEVER
jgi:outer membrane protein OmpA-like peptidoglycan-associated protein